MSASLIHDRGRGPELIGTRITVYNLLSHFFDPTVTEEYVCRLYDLTPEQVAAARAYVMAHYTAVLAADERIEERLRREADAQDTPENRARAAAGLARLARYRAEAGARPSDAPMPSFREWFAAQTPPRPPSGG